MKTEKRLTMALSVLVALMMLAVPLASSSNLFVDGGQTNSNGDAPLLGAASYRVDFILNESSDGRISLDEASVAVDELDKADGNIAWYSGEDGNVFAVVTGDITIQYLLWALNQKYTDSNGKGVDIVSKTGYELDIWKDSSSSTYTPSTTKPVDAENKITGDKITKNMTLTAKWLFDDSKYAEIPVDVIVDGELFKEYVKVYPLLKNGEGVDEKNVSIYTEGTFIARGVKGVSECGVIVNFKKTDGEIIAKEDSVYSFKTTYGDDKELSKEIDSDHATKVPVTSKLTMTYTFDEKNFSKIVVSSVAFKDGKDVTLYADKNRGYTYGQVLDALRYPFETSSTNIKAAITLKDLKTTGETNSVYFKDGKAITENGYELSGWNEGDQLLLSENNASSPLTLDAKLNGYYALFMSKGQFEYVYVPFGELSADLVKTLDIAGVNHWVYITYGVYSGGSFAIDEGNVFSSFSDSLVKTIDGLVPTNYDGKTPIAVFVACFESRTNTSYAMFDAGDANFGNEYVNRIVISGKVGNAISLPSTNPTYDDEETRYVFLGWDRSTGNGNIPSGADDTGTYASTDKYTKQDSVEGYVANPQSYDYKITFYDGSEVVGVLYYKGVAPTTDLKSTSFVAFEYNGKVYDANDLSNENENSELYEAATNAYNDLIAPSKDGHTIKQWNDVNKNKVIEVTITDSKIKTVLDIKDMKDDLNLYAEFKANTYTIKYSNTFGDSQEQTAYVDEAVKLYGEIYLNEGFKLIGWSTSAGSSQVEYELEGSFTLSGADYEKLAEKSADGSVVVNMYPVWEKLGSGSGTGGNTGGDNDNTALYLIAGMLAVIAILAIVGILLMRRK